MERTSDDADSVTRSASRKKIVVILGATGTGKSRLAIDLAAHFPIEIINADSMQVYRGLDILTNKVPLTDQNGVPHHLLGCVSPTAEFTAKDFRDAAIPIIDDILWRDCMPVVVGGTNYYIQALVSPFLLDDSMENLDDASFSHSPGGFENEDDDGSHGSSYDRLVRLDPLAACRIHPNDHRKIDQFLRSYARSGVLPSDLFQGEAIENWGSVDKLRYNCCFICVDASLPVVDKYVNERVDCMLASGLLDEVREIYLENASYTQGLRQAIGVREFEGFLKRFPSGQIKDHSSSRNGDDFFDNQKSRFIGAYTQVIVNSSDCEDEEMILQQAIDNMKMHTRRLVRRQKRRISRLQSLFGWKINFVDVTEFFSSDSTDSWVKHVLQPTVETIRSFLNDDGSTVDDTKVMDHKQKILERNLWTQYTCEACGNKVLRGTYEWTQHIQGRGHRKRLSSLRKSQRLQSQHHQQPCL